MHLHNALPSLSQCNSLPGAIASRTSSLTPFANGACHPGLLKDAMGPTRSYLPRHNSEMRWSACRHTPRGPRALTARPRPKISVQILSTYPSPWSPPDRTSPRRSAQPRSSTVRSPGGSTLYGSDIIRASVQGHGQPCATPGRKDRQQGPRGSSPPKFSSTQAQSIQSSTSHSMRTSMTPSPHRSLRYYSWATTARVEVPAMPVLSERVFGWQGPMVVTPTFGMFSAGVRRERSTGGGGLGPSPTNTEPFLHSAPPLSRSASLNSPPSYLEVTSRASS